MQPASPKQPASMKRIKKSPEKRRKTTVKISQEIDNPFLDNRDQNLPSELRLWLRQHSHLSWQLLQGLQISYPGHGQQNLSVMRNAMTAQEAEIENFLVLPQQSNSTRQETVLATTSERKWEEETFQKQCNQLQKSPSSTLQLQNYEPMELLTILSRDHTSFKEPELMFIND